MMRSNPYRGINAHLNSLLQTAGSVEQPSIFPPFHAMHIAHLVDALNAQLPNQYRALSEQSLQTRGLDIVGNMTWDQHTFQAGRWGDLLDYQTEPERFETYSAADQARILAVMAKQVEGSE